MTGMIRLRAIERLPIPARGEEYLRAHSATPALRELRISGIVVSDADARDSLLRFVGVVVRTT